MLIVDDSNLMKHLLQSIIEDAGHEVVGVASNEREAVKFCKQLKPAIRDKNGHLIIHAQVVRDKRLLLR